MSGRHIRSRERAGAVWRDENKAEKQHKSLVTPDLRDALREMMLSEPERFIAACIEVRIISLWEVPAYEQLALQHTPEHYLLRLYLKRLAEEAGIQTRRDTPCLR